MRISFCAWLSIAFTLFSTGFSYSQFDLNMVLHDSLGYSTGINDVVGWVDESGNEYALVGVRNGVSIVNVDVNPIEEVVFVPGVNNGWRDINTFGHYAYVVSEARVGLVIIDLQFLPDSVKTYEWKGNIPGGTFEKAHTIWIDEYGIGYLNGSNLNEGGVIMVDLATNPTEPIYLGSGPPRYSHDVYARDSILYSAEIYHGTISIYDVHDPQNVIMIGSKETPTAFTHNAWLSDNSRYLFTTDERPNSYVASYDIIDPSNIVELDRFRQADTDGSGNIPHNVYVWNDWLVIAYYTSGTLIVDASRPDNLIEVGSFDSFLGPDGDYEGVWGSYPFLPSGKILSSDRTNGLFVFIPNYVRAAFIEGTVIDSVTQMPIQGAKVTIVSNEIVLPQLTEIDGTFKTGKAIPGTFSVRVEKPGYITKILPADFVNGQVLTPVYELVALPSYSVSGRVIDAGGNNVPNAKVVLIGVPGIFEIETDDAGEFLLPVVYEGTYEVQAGIWGMTMQTDIELFQSQDLTLQLSDGYYDDFDLDLGWVISSDVTQGEWERGIPSIQYFGNWVCGPPSDSPYDIGQFVYSTGLAETSDVTGDEVSGGNTLLISPEMDLDSIAAAHISFDFWLCEYPPNQYVGFTVWLSDGEELIFLKAYQMDPNFMELEWRRETIIVDEWSGPKDKIRFVFMATDTTQGQMDYYLKVLVDNFRVTDGTVSTKDELSPNNLFVFYPNPVDDNPIYLKTESLADWKELTLHISDLQGRIISEHTLSRTDAENGFSHQLESGMYLIQWLTDKGESGVNKILVMRN